MFRESVIPEWEHVKKSVMPSEGLQNLIVMSFPIVISIQGKPLGIVSKQKTFTPRNGAQFTN